MSVEVAPDRANGSGSVGLLTGVVLPSTHGPHVEQVGWGVARQVAHLLAERVGSHPLLARVPQVAEAPGWAAYAVFEGQTAVALGLLSLGASTATWHDAVVLDTAPPATRLALVVRALHDAAAAGVATLLVSEPTPDLAVLPVVSDH